MHSQAKPNAVKQALLLEGLEVEDFGGSVQVGACAGWR